MALAVSLDGRGAVAQPASRETIGDPTQWSPDKKVNGAIARVQELKEAARQFSRRECPKTRADFGSWLDEGLDLAGSLIGLQDSTRQIRKTGASAERLQAWDAVRAANGSDRMTELTDLLGRCGRRVVESDPAFRPPGQEELVRRASVRIAEKKRSELAAVGIPFEETDGPKGESSPPRRIH